MTAPDGRQFEEEVRALARARWNLAPGAGGAQNVNGQEIDCVAETEEVTHLVMCTVSRKLDKLRADVDKLVKAGRHLSQRGHTTKLWAVTLDEPTADQKEYAKRSAVVTVSVAEYRRALINAEQYFDLRSRYRFGSAADPESHSQKLPEDEYVPSGIVDVDTGERASVKSIARLLEHGDLVVLIGTFGAGKSVSLREIFFELRRRFGTTDKRLLPIALNLREHWMQPSPAEVLMRHANILGYPRAADLVRVWNAGAAIPLLDGFDELSTQSLVSSVRTRRQARYAATAIVREFVSGARGHAGILITGRANYFDSYSELRTALGLRKGDRIFEILPFDEQQAETYLAKKGFSGGLPAWLPRSPLLLSYLATSQMLREVASIEAMDSAAQAWDEFLDRIARRDAELGSDLDPPTVRHLLERLATRTRLTVGGVKALDDAEIGAAFREVVGSSAFDATHVLLQRLPGLTPRGDAEGTRSFVDAEMVEALRGSDVFHYLVNPYKEFIEGTLQHPLSQFGCEMVVHLTEKAGLSEQQMLIGARQATERWNEGTLALDSLLSASMRHEGETDAGGLAISNGLADMVDLGEHPLAGVVLNGCYIGTLRIGDGQDRRLELQNCIIGRIEGAGSQESVPTWMATSAAETFDEARTNDALLDLAVPLPVRVLLTLLRKMYVQRGRGRKENSLWRGLDVRARDYVGPVLELMTAEGLAWRTSRGGSVVWHGDPSQRGRVLAILDAPLSAGDPLIPRIAELER